MQHMVMTTGNGQNANPNKGMGGPTSSLKGINSNASGVAQKGTANSQNTASGKNMRSMSLSKRLAMTNDIQMANATIDIGSMMYP